MRQSNDLGSRNWTPLGPTRIQSSVFFHRTSSAFPQLSTSLHAHLAAKGAHEGSLVEQMAESQWRFNRLCRIETAFMDQILLIEPGPDPEE
jgi:hypothetical protein